MTTKDQAFLAAEANPTLSTYKALVEGAVHLPEQYPNDGVSPATLGLGCGGVWMGGCYRQA